MDQVTLKPRKADPKMTEEKRAKEAPGGGKTPKPELQTVRFEWPGLPAGTGSDILIYKPNQRRPGDQPQGVQTVPAIWLPSPHGAPWQYNGVTEEGLATHAPAPGWYSMKHIFACGGLIIVLLVLLSYLDRYRLLSRFRPRRSQVHNTLKVVCQLRDDKSASKLPMKSNDPSNNDMPASYSRIDLKSDGASNEGKLNDLFAPYSCIFTSAKGKVPRVFFYDSRKDKEVMEKMGLSSIKGQPFTTQHMKINVPSQVDINDPKKEMANFVIEINDTETESGCVIGMNVLVDKNHEDAILLDDRNGIPFSVTLEQLKCNDPKKLKKSHVGGKK